MAEQTFLGVPLDELPFEDVDWSHRAEHIRNRSARKHGDFNVEPEWATEAVFDEERLVGPDPNSKSGRGLRVVGWSPSANRVLVVILIPKHPVVDGCWYGATAWAADSRMIRRYYTTGEGGGTP